MNTLTLNIGLENNPKEAGNIVTLLDYWLSAEKSKNKTELSEYKGVKERTLIYTVQTNTNINTIVALIEDLCKLTTQESIAFTMDEYKMLVFNPNYKGEIFDFDEKYFVKW